MGYTNLSPISFAAPFVCTTKLQRDENPLTCHECVPIIANGVLGKYARQLVSTACLELHFIAYYTRYRRLKFTWFCKGLLTFRGYEDLIKGVDP